MNEITLPTFLPVTDSDMAFVKSRPIGGQLFLRMAHDANRAAVPLIVGHTVGNEDYESHKLFDKATK